MTLQFNNICYCWFRVCYLICSQPMDALEALILQEQAKLAILEREVADRRARLTTLTSMRKVDALDSLLAGRLPSDESESRGVSFPTATEGPIAAVPQEGGTRRKRGSVRDAVLRSVAVSDSALKDVEARLVSLGLTMTQGALRTALWQLKNEGLIVSKKAGVFALSASGAAAVRGLGAKVYE
jgi:hypothetical protein